MSRRSQGSAAKEGLGARGRRSRRARRRARRARRRGRGRGASGDVRGKCGGGRLRVKRNSVRFSFAASGHFSIVRNLVADVDCNGPKCKHHKHPHIASLFFWSRGSVGMWASWQHRVSCAEVLSIVRSCSVALPPAVLSFHHLCFGALGTESLLGMGSQRIGSCFIASGRAGRTFVVFHREWLI